jgi:hypothetical protein
LRPPPWLALPPLLAISRCFAGSIAANPRFDLPVLFVAMIDSPNCHPADVNAARSLRFTLLTEVRNGCSDLNVGETDARDTAVFLYTRAK